MNFIQKTTIYNETINDYSNKKVTVYNKKKTVLLTVSICKYVTIALRNN